MPYSADILVGQTTTTQWTGGGVSYIVQTPSGVFYLVYIDVANDVVYKKSTDGYTWGEQVVIFAGTTTQLSIWYDRWSNISAGLIHIAYTESVTDDTLYRTIDTESSDTLSTQTVIFAGASTLNGGCHLSITRAVGGNVYCKAVIDSGSEGGFFRLPNANVPNGAWDAARTVDEAIASGDQMILLPNLTAADTQDIMAIFCDNSVAEISRKLYDDSANSWSETLISTGMAVILPSNILPQLATAVDIANNRIILVAWSNADIVNSDLRCWIITDSSITEVTNVILNSGDDQALTAISIDINSGNWHVYYAGKSDGSETYPTSMQIYTKISKDDGSTWGAETLVNNTGLIAQRWLVTCPRLYYSKPVFAYVRDGAIDEIMFNIPLGQPRAYFQLGI